MGRGPNKKNDILSSKTPIDKKDFNLKSFKNTENLTQIKDKDLNWFNLSDAFYEITKLPGIPKGYFTIVRGFPNTGKSTIKLELIKSCQENGVLPVIIETENNIRIRLRSRGPVINELASKYNGGGHKMASGATLLNWEELDSLVKDVDDLILIYKGV